MRKMVGMQEAGVLTPPEVFWVDGGNRNSMRSGCPYRRSVRHSQSEGPELPQPSRCDQNSLEAHDERAALIVDGRADVFEQVVSD
jgi:hypothetical protein